MTQKPDTISPEAVAAPADSLTTTQPLGPKSEKTAASHAEEHESLGDGDSEADPGSKALPNKKKKKSKGKTTASRGATALPKNRGTGFEEYYADPPMTPAEATEEKEEIYAPSLSFAERIQGCIQRFRARRRLQNPANLYFDEYLFLGGVDTNPGAFTGVDPRDLKDMTPAERRDATARDVVYTGSAGGDRFYTGDEENWSVDFAGVAAGFFSTVLVPLTGLLETNLEIAISVVENFLRYVLQHDVCPEHEENVKEGLRVCEAAREEWPMVLDLKTALPGQFNLAAAELFRVADADDWSFQGFKRPEDFQAAPVFCSTMALLDGTFFKSLIGRDAKVVRKFDCTLEVVTVHRTADDVVERFKNLAFGGKPANIPPIGKATFKPSTIDDEWAHLAVPSPFADGDEQEVTLYFDDALLAYMKPGLRMSVTLCELDFGLMFIKSLSKLVPSFYTFLPQQMMKYYKPPKDSERPAPSVSDPEADEKLLAKEAREG